MTPYINLLTFIFCRLTQKEIGESIVHQSLDSQVMNFTNSCSGWFQEMDWSRGCKSKQTKDLISINHQHRFHFSISKPINNFIKYILDRQLNARNYHYSPVYKQKDSMNYSRVIDVMNIFVFSCLIIYLSIKVSQRLNMNKLDEFDFLQAVCFRYIEIRSSKLQLNWDIIYRDYVIQYSMRMRKLSQPPT